MSSIEEVRNKIQHEFKTKEEYYKYCLENGRRLSREELYNDASDSLLPIFKVAKEMCEYISGDKDYFKKNDSKHGYPLIRLYHMAVASKVIQDINENCITTDDKAKCIQLFAQNYETGHFTYLENGKPIKTTPLFSHEKIYCFMRTSDLGFDDQYYHQYIGGIQEDIKPEFSHDTKPRCSVAGNTQNWDDMKDSAVLYALAKQFIIEEGWKLQEERKQSSSSIKLGDEEERYERFKIFRQAENNVQAKINEFCDMKQAQFIKQMQMSNTEVKS